MRAVVWIVVGLLVVAGLIFVFVVRSQQPGTTGKLTPNSIKNKAEFFAKKADGLEADVKEFQEKLTKAGKLDAHKSQLDELLAKANLLREKAKVLESQANDIKAATATKNEMENIRKEAEQISRRLKKAVR